MSKLVIDENLSLKNLYRKGLQVSLYTPVNPYFSLAYMSAHRLVARIQSVSKELVEHACLWELSLLIWGGDPITTAEETYKDLCKQFDIKEADPLSLAKIKEVDYQISSNDFSLLEKVVDQIGIMPISRNAFNREVFNSMREDLFSDNT